METTSAIQNFIQFLGPFRWPLFIISAMVIFQIIKKGYHYFYQNKPIRKGLHAILFWGCITLLVGFIGQFSGIWVILNSIQESSDISPQLMISGFLSSYIPSLYGFIVGLVAALAWWVLRYRYKELKGSGHSHKA